MRPKSILFLVSIFGIGLADAIFKVYALQHFPSEQTALMQSILTFALHKNPGIAFDIPIPLFIVLPITGLIAGAFAYLAIKRWQTNRSESVAAIAAIVGAVGNAVDRLINGFTTDYLILFKTSAINLSDILILLGILAVIWYDKHTPQLK